jgi:NADH dehydrogenase
MAHDMPDDVHVVTGAFGYSGRYIAQRLLREGCRVRTLTNSPQRHSPLSGKIEVFPLQFQRPEQLREALQGAAVLYNTYWVRFNHRDFTFAAAVANTKTLFRTARKAGVRRIVHVSITNPSLDSPLEYFRGKAELERELIDSGIPCTILRPAVLFGHEDILINNIAWTLRHFPLFGVFGDGNYRLQPIYVDDLAELAVTAGLGGEGASAGPSGSTSHGPGRGQDKPPAAPVSIVNAIGPETFTYRQLATKIGQIIGRPRPIVSIPPALGCLAAWLIGKAVRDVVVTRAEIAGLMAGLLYVDAPPAGRTHLTAWAAEHAAWLGRRYASELARRQDRLRDYSA